MHIAALLVATSDLMHLLGSAHLIVRFSVDFDAPGPSYGHFGWPAGHGRAENSKTESDFFGKDPKIPKI